ncbi:MAG: hypothetical protein SPJ62_12310 [Inconstantimicrobium porci]|uniref:hypothetical protein n=1 Tax=Inconstantimicrobium porci TaxID=2652291 RepID=UPI002409A1EE|nr:hypothetical protein [Inconstantimicrobium porci]MDD6770057.1 hypothetical protein [Inconstantimicrobium porci]MDY5912756.1 hypothetical protein [Inconstantimicrobium porci]
MSFSRNFITLIKNRNNDIFEINNQNGLIISRYGNKNKLIYSKKIFDGHFTFIDYWFEIDNNDNIYGIVNDKKGSLIYILIKDRIIVKKRLLNFNTIQISIKYVSIKIINNSINIFYYCSEKSSPHKCNLIHYHKNTNGWRKNIIDLVSYNTLTNYVTLYNSSKNMSILYYKLCNNHEELFLSLFNKESLRWEKPIQLTNSRHDKIYLSALIDKKNNYHILFSEKDLYKYQCSYIQGYIDNNHFTILHYNTLGDATACSFPTILEQNSRISAQWSEYNNLYFCISDDSGDTWGPVLINPKIYISTFTCCNYKTNPNRDNEINSYSVFVDLDTFKILGT